MVTRLLQLNRTLLLSILAVFTCFFVVILNPDFSSAATKGLTLSPLRTELEIAPGTSLDGVLTVANSTDKPMTVDLSAEEFSVINQQYDYAFTAESDMAKWVAFTPVEVNLAASESKKITYNVGVPLSAEPGGRYISLFASTDTGITDGGVSSRQRIASLLYITVLGDVSRSGHLVSLSSPWAVTSESKWSTALPKLPGLYKYVFTIGLGDTPAVVETRFVLYMPPVAIAISIVAVIILVSWLLRRRPKK
jgi:hypothetical protein